MATAHRFRTSAHRRVALAAVAAGLLMSAGCGGTAGTPTAGSGATAVPATTSSAPVSPMPPATGATSTEPPPVTESPTEPTQPPAPASTAVTTTLEPATMTVTATALPPKTVTATATRPPATVTVMPPPEVDEGPGIRCAGEYIVLVGSVIGDDQAEVARLLGQFPGAQSAGTGVCTSMTQRTDDGRSITAIYLGPFAAQSDACAARAQVGGDSQVRLMTPSSEPLGPQTC